MPLPEGLSTSGPERGVARLELLTDITYQQNGVQRTEQVIFDRVLGMIDRADRFVVIDMFLFNEEHTGDRDYRPITSEITERILARRQAVPTLDVTFITDEINDFYGAYRSTALRRLEEGGVRVVITDLRRLRDSNPMFSSIWRTYLQWFGTAGPGFAPHPLTSTAQRVTLRSYLKLLNMKANHRKVIVTEDGCMMLSANPHDASSFHSNIAFDMQGPVCSDILESERAVAAFSGHDVPAQVMDEWTDFEDPSTVRLVTEGEIRAVLIDELDALEAGDRADVAMFYLSGRRVIEAIKSAAQRGASVRLLLDPNKDAFGRQKGGIPNRQVARELVGVGGGAVGDGGVAGGGIEVRWYDTHGEQFHTKLLAFHTPRGTTLLGGSANLTRRNLGDYNLEADLLVRASEPLAARASDYFERLWANQGGDFSVPYEAYADDSWVKRVFYRLQESTGLSSF
jgi:phosphatidylserine/phosphatidylglycerophosphate/cardiolipin synthase-like enzyme